MGRVVCCPDYSVMQEDATERISRTDAKTHREAKEDWIFLRPWVFARDILACSALNDCPIPLCCASRFSNPHVDTMTAEVIVLPRKVAVPEIVSTIDVTSIVDEHWDAVYRLLRTLCGNVHDTEDLTQETFLRAMKK